MRRSVIRRRWPRRGRMAKRTVVKRRPIRKRRATIGRRRGRVSRRMPLIRTVGNMDRQGAVYMKMRSCNPFAVKYSYDASSTFGSAVLVSAGNVWIPTVGSAGLMEAMWNQYDNAKLMSATCIFTHFRFYKMQSIWSPEIQTLTTAGNYVGAGDELPNMMMNVFRDPTDVGNPEVVTTSRWKQKKLSKNSKIVMKCPLHLDSMSGVSRTYSQMVSQFSTGTETDTTSYTVYTALMGNPGYRNNGTAADSQWHPNLYMLPERPFGANYFTANAQTMGLGRAVVFVEFDIIWETKWMMRHPLKGN